MEASSVGMKGCAAAVLKLPEGDVGVIGYNARYSRPCMELCGAYLAFRAGAHLVYTYSTLPNDLTWEHKDTQNWRGVVSQSTSCVSDRKRRVQN